MTSVIITAGGVGSRVHQNIPKQFIPVNGKPLIIYTLLAFQNHNAIDEIYVVCLKGWEEKLSNLIEEYKITKVKKIVEGGSNGQESIYNGLKAISNEYNDTSNIKVLIHDGNRPMVSKEIIDDNLETQIKYGCAITAIPTVEVIFSSDDGVKSSTLLDREKLWRTQTPHCFDFDYIFDMYNKAKKDNVTNMAAACALLQKYNEPIYFSKGSEKNIKITTMDDLDIFEALLKEKK